MSNGDPWTHPFSFLFLPYIGLGVDDKEGFGNF